MGVCKSRSRAPIAVPANAKSKQVEEDAFTAKRSRAAPRNAAAWSRLQEDAPLNPDAEPFYPPTAKSPSKGGSTFTRSTRSADQPKSGAPPQRRAGKSQQGTPASSQQLSQAASTPTPFKLDTDEYMKLLREGDASKRSVSNAGVQKSTAPSPPASHNALVSLQPEKSTMNVKEADSVSAVKLSQMLSAAFVAQQDRVAAPVVERDSVTRKFNDDTLVERFTIDRDISELDYWSEDDEGPSSQQIMRSFPASRHKLQKATKAKKVRTYVMQELSTELDEQTALLLGRVHRFHECLKDVMKRRYSIGLKEVYRRLKQNMIVCLVIAPDIEGSADHGGLDDRMREVLAYAYQHEIPVIFALSRQRIGRAIGKTLNISILGITDVTGAQSLFDQATGLASAQRAAWLRQRGM